jgi:hypothetical protein
MKTKRSKIFIAMAISFFCCLVGPFSAKAQVPSSYTEGHFYNDHSNGKVYWFALGRLRHVQSGETLNGLFTDATKPEHMFHSNSLGAGAPYGSPLTADNGLIHDNSTGKIYFRRQNFIHYIPSEQLFNQYHFSWAAITNVSNVNAYTRCQDMPNIASVIINCNW